MFATAWAVGNAVAKSDKLSLEQRDAILQFVAFPGLIRETLIRSTKFSLSDPVDLLHNRKETERPSWVRRFPAPEDSGYLLFSGVDPKIKQSVIQLIQISDGHVLATWKPDWNFIYERVIDNKFQKKGTVGTARAQHPILLPNGDLIFNASSSLVRVRVCDAQPIWVLNGFFHHSIEFGENGEIWSPSISDDGFSDNHHLRDQIRDDAIAKISIEGQLLEKVSFSNILRKNGFEALLMGTSGWLFNVDPIHMNQISVAFNSTDYWWRGDLLISSRHLSTVFLYRPSTGKIIWHQTGPWMNQHSVAFVGDHKISVFDNHVYSGAPGKQPFLVPGDINHVMIYDFSTGQVTEPFASLLLDARPITMSEGRAQLLSDGGLFVEESNFGRHLRFTKDRLLWSRVNDYDDFNIGRVSWSRYLSPEEVKAPLQAISGRNCSRSGL